jgi:hypothetical protein
MGRDIVGTRENIAMERFERAHATWRRLCRRQKEILVLFLLRLFPKAVITCFARLFARAGVAGKIGLVTFCGGNGMEMETE